METGTYERAKQIFYEALKLPALERDQYIEQKSIGDQHLAARVQRMIHFAEGTSPTGRLLSDCDSVAQEESDDQRLVGATIKQYRILEIIGEGGFGTVFRAEQNYPVQRLVALKILKSGMDSRRVIARFEAERQALAVMEHPNIARVFDAGQTDRSMGLRPYFVMELVSGESITAFCARNHLGCRGRLELMMTVCNAVQHAHQKGIIHRDLKPSNILVSLVDGIASPKIIDFGIAKAIHQPLNQMQVTQRLELLGTPQYMSPEQADADMLGVDTRSDIYSLGVVLYELLTSTTPLESAMLSITSYTRIQEVIRQHVVERPSARVARLNSALGGMAQLQKSDFASLSRRLKGDLDWITLKALEQDRDRRYSSASALADDMRRHLNHEPVLAGPPSAAYRTRKFIRRHRVAMAAAALITIAVIGGAIGTTLGMLRARDSADQALQINQFMHDVLTSVDPELGQGADVRLAEVLSSASATAGQRFASHPELEAQVRELLGRVYLRLSMWPQSRAEFERAQSLWTDIAGPDDRRTLQAQLFYGRALVNEGRSREAIRLMEKIMPMVRSRFRPSEAAPYEAQQALAVAYTLYGQNEQAQSILRAALKEAGVAGADERTRLSLLDGLVFALDKTLQRNSGPERIRIRDELLPLASELAQGAGEHFGPDAIPTLRAQNVLARLAYEQGDYSAARSAAQSLMKASENRLGRCSYIRLEAMVTLSDVLSQDGKWEEASKLQLERLNCIHEHEGNGSITYLAALYDAMPFLDQGGRWTDGDQLAKELVAGLRSMSGGHGGMLFNSELYVARFASLQGRLDEAEALFQPLLARESDVDEDAGVVSRLHLFYAKHLSKRGNFDLAERQLQAAAQGMGNGKNDLHQYPKNIIDEFINLYTAWNKPEKAEEYRHLINQSVPLTIDASAMEAR